MSLLTLIVATRTGLFFFGTLLSVNCVLRPSWVFLLRLCSW
ncbi:hypothetical protein Nmel_003713 [Mimus melanotis]